MFGQPTRVLTLGAILTLGSYALAADPAPAPDAAPAPAPAAAADAPPVIPTPELPKIPDKTFKLSDYGAVGDGKTLDTQAIQKAIDAVGAAGGGILDIAPGTYLTGPFHFASNLNFHLEKGATILLSDDIKQFQIVQRENRDRFDDAFQANGLHDLAITGEGTFDGQGAMWWKSYVEPKVHKPGDKPHRPFMITMDRCQRVLVQGVTLTRSPMFHLVPSACQDVTIDGITIIAPPNAKNTDGIDPSGINYLIKNCHFDTGDDCIALKPNRLIDDNHVACENFLVENCEFDHGHGMSIGGQTPGGLRNLVVRNCTFDSTEAGMRMKAPRGNGGLVENVWYENLTLKNVKYAISISSYYPESSLPPDPATAKAQPITDRTPIWRHIRISNVTSDGGEFAGRIVGLPEMHASDIVLTNVNISAAKPLTLICVDNIKFINSQVTVDKGAALRLIDANPQGIDPDSGKPIHIAEASALR